MLAAKPSEANAAGNASSHTVASGPGWLLYGASEPLSWLHARLRNSALPPAPNCSATGPPAAPSGSAFGGLAGFTGLTGGASSSGGGGGGGAFASFSSPSPSPAALEGVGAFSSF